MSTKKIKPFFAKVSDLALEKANLFFNVNIKTIFDELFQNSRRAGAKTICVTISQPDMRDGGLRVIVADDGKGLDDPEQLFLFGASGWDNQIVKDENPAGIGFFCLSSLKKVKISSANWEICADPQAFKGKKKIVPKILDSQIKGLTVEFELFANNDAVKAIVERCAAYLPVSVFVNNSLVHSKDFLANADHVSYFDGYKIGINFSSFYLWEGYGNIINFFGKLISSNNNTFTFPYLFKEKPVAVRVDITKGDALDFVLPAREQIVNNEKFDNLLKNIRRTYYEFLQKHPETGHDLDYKFYKEACDLGYNIAEARPKLVPWFVTGVHNKQLIPGDDVPDLFKGVDKSRKKITDSSAVINRLYAEHAAALFFAYKTKLPFNVFVPDEQMKGYSWYPSWVLDNVLQVAETKGGTIIQMDPSDSVPLVLTKGSDAEKIEENWNTRVYKSIKVVAALKNRITGESLTYEAPADIIFTSDYYLDEERLDFGWSFSESGLKNITPDWLVILCSSSVDDIDMSDAEYDDYIKYFFREAKRKLTSLKKSEKHAAKEKIIELLQNNHELQRELKCCGNEQIVIRFDKKSNQLKIDFIKNKNL